MSRSQEMMADKLDVVNILNSQKDENKFPKRWKTLTRSHRICEKMMISKTLKPMAKNQDFSSNPTSTKVEH